MSEITPPIFPLERRHERNDDRAGRLVVAGVVVAMAFLLVAAAIWWAGGADPGHTDAMAARASTVTPSTSPATIGDAAAVSAASTLPLSSYPVPAQGIAMTDAPQSPAPSSAQPAAPPVTEAVAPATVADSTTTTSISTTTTAAPTTTVRPTTTVGSTTTITPTTVAAPAVAVTTTPPSTTTSSTPTSTSTSTTTPPATTAPAPVVTSPASADATLLDVVTDTPDLSRVRELVELSGFAPELDAARPLTFAAPSNAAVDAWAATPEGRAVLADPDAVYGLLLGHLVPEAVDEATIFTRTSLDTLSGGQLVVRQQSRTVGGADLLVVDVNAANGILHVMSDVLA